jgi:hypothetical protein
VQAECPRAGPVAAAARCDTLALMAYHERQFFV